MNNITITEIDDLNKFDTNELVAKSLSEDFSFIKRLVTEYQNGQNRFDQTGEILFGVFNGTKLIAIGGLNRDPYTNNSSTGRVRHLYVHPEWRRQGVGKAIVEAIITTAKLNFHLLTLRTFNEDADHFYRALGFEKTSSIESASHFLVLKES